MKAHQIVSPNKILLTIAIAASLSSFSALRADESTSEELAKFGIGIALDKMPENLNIYKSTAQSAQRTIHTLPNFSVLRFKEQTNHNDFSLTAFYNQTCKKKINGGTTIEHFFDLPSDETIDAFPTENSDTIIGLIQFAQNIFPQLSVEGAQQILNHGLPLFKTMKKAFIEERKFGIMTNFYHTSDDFSLDITLPFYWIERNMNFSSAHLKEIYNNDIVKQALAASTFNERNFGFQHLVYDKLGLGNMQINVEHLFFDKNNWKIYGGVGLDLPTEATFAVGEIGANLELKNRIIPVDFSQLTYTDGDNKIYLSSNGIQILNQYVLNYLDQLSSNLLHVSLGNKKHFGFEVTCTPSYENILNSDWSWQSECHLKYLLPSREKRQFILKNISKTAITETLAETSSDLEYVNTFISLISETLFPQVYKATVHPGLILYETTYFQNSFGQDKNWDVTLGWNNYWQNKEKITTIQANEATKSTLDIIKAQRNQTCYQLKLFSKLHHIFHSKNYAWHVGAYVDGTVYDSNMGNDFTVALSLDYEF